MGTTGSQTNTFGPVNPDFLNCSSQSFVVDDRLQKISCSCRMVSLNSNELIDKLVKLATSVLSSSCKAKKLLCYEHCDHCCFHTICNLVYTVVHTVFTVVFDNGMLLICLVYFSLKSASDTILVASKIVSSPTVWAALFWLLIETTYVTQL